MAAVSNRSALGQCQPCRRFQKRLKGCSLLTNSRHQKEKWYIEAEKPDIWTWNTVCVLCWRWHFKELIHWKTLRPPTYAALCGTWCFSGRDEISVGGVFTDMCSMCKMTYTFIVMSVRGKWQGRTSDMITWLMRHLCVDFHVQKGQ